jgi:hypothetical protein
MLFSLNSIEKYNQDSVSIMQGMKKSSCERLSYKRIRLTIVNGTLEISPFSAELKKENHLFT